MRLNKQILFLGWFFYAFVTSQAQQPFVTDDAEVTENGKVHLELTSAFDRLQTSAFPVKYQNGTRITAAYGLFKNVEVSTTMVVLTLVKDRGMSPRFVTGLGDTTFAVKYKILKESEGSRRPALAISAHLQVPTGNSSRSLGSGVTDFGFYGVAQKTYKEKNVFRVNLGYVASGNTGTGVPGIPLVRGHVFTGGTSYVRNINEKLQVGGEIAGAVTTHPQLSKGQLQTQFGGNYQINPKTTFDFGFIVGRFSASPRFGLQIGFSRDF